MPYLRVANVRVDVSEPESRLPRRVARRLGLSEADVARWRILRKSLDARSRRELRWVYTILVELPEGDLVRRCLASEPADVDCFVPPRFDDPEPGREPLEQRPVVIGSGPAGLLAGYFLALKGYRPLIIERGQPVKPRVRQIRAFEAGGEHDPENNYLFGEGGAGTFSDGKLTCRMSGPDVEWVLERFVDCGGKPSLAYEQRPHLGSDRVPVIVRNLRRRIEAFGGEYYFGCVLEGLDIVDGGLRGLHTSRGTIAATQAVLGIGHSARATYGMLLDAGIPMRQKAFQLGLRIEQPQDQVNRHKYGRPEYLSLLGAADYSLTAHGQRDVYSFCMCAGGMTIPSISEPGCFATNGMSNSRRDTPFANSGIMVTLEPHEFGSAHVLAGVELQRRYEMLAFVLAGRNYSAPIQTAADFVAGRTPPRGQRLESSYQRGTTPLNLNEILPPVVSAAIRSGLPMMDSKWHGDFLAHANLLGPEMRGSAPVRIERDAVSRQSPACRGLYPVGEGAGYAGGIVSAAVDGLRSARQIVRQFGPLGSRL
ncbi:MAG: FAD-dependent oxidoreductase [Planctomycetes bacterium]|nr:FAD-dependent oxidoreductase [Planctomycetota bacterium]